MRLITACFARVPQRWTSRIYIHFLLMFQEVRLISKTRNQLHCWEPERVPALLAEQFLRQREVPFCYPYAGRVRPEGSPLG